MTGTVVTFYSFKGGVGRSFALANIAILLARWGYRVLTVDWDLEAPGLHEYFRPLITERPPGIVDLVDDFTAGRVKPAAAYNTTLAVGEPGTVDFLSAGRSEEPSYPGRVQAIDWAGLYERGFADFLERMRAEWTADYDFVLIDSRTGISDIAGICTAHLPDQLVLLFTANRQSLGGAVDMAGRADAARDRMPYDRAQLTVLPVLSRFDGRVEYELAERWYGECAELTTPLFQNWLVRNASETWMLRQLTLPNVSYWTFGEQLPVRAERTPATDQISYALETVAAIIAHRFDRTDLLADNRDAYVAEARAQERGFELDLRVSTTRSVLPAASALTEKLQALGATVKISLSGDPDFLAEADEPARHLCLVIDEQLTRWQNAEAEQFIRHTLGTSGDRRLFLVLTSNVDPGTLPGFLRNLHYLRLGGDARPQAVARGLYGHMASDALRADTDRQVDAAFALSQVLARLPYPSRWDLIRQTVLAMSDALNGDDLESLDDLTLDLKLASRARAGSHEHIEAPAAVLRLIVAVLGKIYDRIGSRRPAPLADGHIASGTPVPLAEGHIGGGTAPVMAETDNR